MLQRYLNLRFVANKRWNCMPCIIPLLYFFIYKSPSKTPPTVKRDLQ